MDKITQVIEKVKLKAKENFVPIVRDKTLEALLSICNEKSVVNVLEIGTATGYSGLNILKIAKTLTTIEKNKDRVMEAESNFAEAEVLSRTTQLQGDAGELLEEMAERGESFDLVFLDGPKGQYIKYLPYIKALLKKGGALFADNILLGGLIKDPSLVTHKNRAMYNNMKDFLKEIKFSKDFQSTIYEIEDGFSISIKQ